MKGMLTIAAMAALALFVFSAWGLRGSLVLIALWGLSYVGFFFWHRRAQRLIRERLARMDEQQRAEALSALSEADRIEVLDAIKVNERQKALLRERSRAVAMAAKERLTGRSPRRL